MLCSLIFSLFVFVISVSVGAEAEDAIQAVTEEPRESSTPPDLPYWHSVPGEQGYLSIGYNRTPDSTASDDLTGVMLTWGIWGEDPNIRFPKEFGFYLSLGEIRNSAQAIWTTGVGVDLSILRFGPVRVFPRVGLGLTYSTDNPDDGLGMFTALGLGTAIWLGHHTQLVLAVHRDFNMPGMDTTRYGIEFRWLSEKIPIPIFE